MSDTKILKKLLGRVAVDSGLIIIGDPCYAGNEYDYDGIIKSLGEKIYTSLDFKSGHKGAGVISSTYYGDGEYNVYGYFEEGDPIGLPLKIEIVFNEEEVNLE